MTRRDQTHRQQPTFDFDAAIQAALLPGLPKQLPPRTEQRISPQLDCPWCGSAQKKPMFQQTWTDYQCGSSIGCAHQTRSDQCRRNRGESPQFDGDTYDAAHDENRLRGALGRVFSLMIDGKRRTLPEIASQAETSEAGASARLRDFRKDKFKAVYPEVQDVRSERVSGGVWWYWFEVRK